jgi:hypothetical protein
MSPDDEEFEQKWSELVENVEHHVQEEESELIPEVEDTQMDLSEFGEEMAERKEELMEENGMDGKSSSRSRSSSKSRGSSKSKRSTQRSTRH